jgi:hypothetical protein
MSCMRGALCANMLKSDGDGGKWDERSRGDGKGREEQGDDEEKGVEMMAV